MMEIKNIGELRECTKELDASTPIFLGVWNGYSDTYTLADHIFTAKYEEIENDFFGTRGKMDKRLFNNDFEGKDILYIGSLFHRNIDNKEIDFPDNPNEPIEFINGKDGDHDLFWKSNGFTKDEDNECWKLENEAEQWFILYYPKSKQITIDKGEKYHYFGECIGLEDFFDIVKSCKIDKTWRIG